jgi:hypothetical protein
MSVPVSQQYGHCVAVVICNGEICYAIAIKVLCNDLGWIATQRKDPESVNPPVSPPVNIRRAPDFDNFRSQMDQARPGRAGRMTGGAGLLLSGARLRFLVVKRCRNRVRKNVGEGCLHFVFE